MVLFRALRRFARMCRNGYIAADVREQLRHVAAMGSGCSINGPIRLGNPSGLTIGDKVCINPGFSFDGCGKLTIGSHCHFGADVRILTSNHNFDRPACLPYDKVRIPKNVTIGECVWICDRVTIVPGVTIGEGAILGAGAVVTRDVEPMAIIGGNPAQFIRFRDADAYLRLKAAELFL